MFYVLIYEGRYLLCWAAITANNWAAGYLGFMDFWQKVILGCSRFNRTQVVMDVKCNLLIFEQFIQNLIYFICMSRSFAWMVDM